MPPGAVASGGIFCYNRAMENTKQSRYGLGTFVRAVLFTAAFTIFNIKWEDASSLPFDTFMGILIGGFIAFVFAVREGLPQAASEGQKERPSLVYKIMVGTVTVAMIFILYRDIQIKSIGFYWHILGLLLLLTLHIFRYGGSLDPNKIKLRK